MDHSPPLSPAVLSLPQAARSVGGPERAFDTDAYRDFLRGAAGELVATPDTVISLLAGSAFRVLRPELYQKVRQGQTRFGLSAEQVFDDLAASCARLRRTLSRRLHFWFVRGARYLFTVLRLTWFVRIVFPLTKRKMLGPPVDITLANPSRRGMGREGPPQASIVVLSHNRLAYLRTTIAAFLETVGDTPCELIAVDNGSRDGSAEFLRDCRHRGIVNKLVLLAENQGISAGYNHGFAAANARSQFIMKLDSDIKILSRGWLAEAIDFLSANQDVGFVALYQVNHPVLPLLQPLRWGGRELLDFADWTVGSAMIIPMRVKQELGGFVEDPELCYTPDDIDYYVRASRKGYRAFFLKQVRVYHQWNLDRTDYWGYSRAKPAGKSAQLAIRLAGEYDRGTRPLAVHHEKYQ